MWYSGSSILDSRFSSRVSACTRVFIRRTKGKRKEKMRNAIVSIKIQRVSESRMRQGREQRWKWRK